MGRSLNLHVDGDGVVASVMVGSLNTMSDEEVALPNGEKIRVFITDPPYNLDFDYGDEVDDDLPEEEYKQLLLSTFKRCFEVADDHASLFIIHYTEALAKIYNELIDIGWEFRQFIPWVYSSNTGHSENKWSTSHREILWLTKGEPHFYSRGVMQRFKNPTAKSVKKKMAEGITGVALYDWWVIQQVKNVNKEYSGYKNQIPQELIRRIILCASEPGDWVADPFSGTYSTVKTALENGRRGWGCDLNSQTKKFWPGEDLWAPREVDPPLPNVDSNGLDGILDLITPEHLNKATLKLFKSASEEDLIKAVGVKNGPRIWRLFNLKKTEQQK